MTRPIERTLLRSRDLGFLGPGTVDSHIAHASAFLRCLPEKGSVLDLGSGGGLPGLVIAVERPDLRVVLLDASERRVAFLRWAVRELGAANAEIALGRAGMLARDPSMRGAFETVTARSFGPAAATAEYGAAFVGRGGQLVVSEPPEDVPGRWDDDQLAAIGLRRSAVHQGKRARVLVMEQMGSCPDWCPRPERTVTRRPLF